ncbi:pimelyl-ACP methyl ester esterase BioV [Sulfurimonas sp.]
MKFYSGFSLKNEKVFFKDYIKDSEYSACGFSYGAIKAFEYIKEQLACGNRIDTLQLLSPAFFQTKSEKFKRLQTLAYTKSEDKYLSQFIDGCFFPHAKKEIEHTQTTLDELEELLEYEWILPDLQEIVDKGVKIEVYLGEKDKIIDVVSAKELFLEVSTVTYIKNANHFLQTQ